MIIRIIINIIISSSSSCNNNSNTNSNNNNRNHDQPSLAPPCRRSRIIRIRRIMLIQVLVYHIRY